jgi:hypothetical protein
VEPRSIFKVTILSHDETMLDSLREDDSVFGLEFIKSYTQTRGAAFAYSHFVVDNQRLTAQFWMLDSNPQWAMVRNLYLKGVSGILVLIDTSKKGAVEMINRLLREFIGVNRFSVPIIVFNAAENKNDHSRKSKQFASEIERWSGMAVPHLNHSDDSVKIENELKTFMADVRDWRAKTVIFQTLKVYFDLDAIQNKTRSVARIAKQLRRIYTSRYYNLIDDQKLLKIIQSAAIHQGFLIDDNDNSVIYNKKLSTRVWEDSSDSDEIQNEIKKPTVKRIS